MQSGSSGRGAARCRAGPLVARPRPGGARRLLAAAGGDPGTAAEASRRHAGRIVVSIDAREGVVAVEGWREETELHAESFLQKLAGLGVPRFVYTDINRDALLASPNYEM